jgi:hypothetical protein
LNLRPLGYEHYDARLWYPIPSPAAALSSTDVRTAALRGQSHLPRSALSHPARFTEAFTRPANRYRVKRVTLRPHHIRRSGRQREAGAKHVLPLKDGWSATAIPDGTDATQIVAEETGIDPSVAG